MASDGSASGPVVTDSTAPATPKNEQQEETTDKAAKVPDGIAKENRTNSGIETETPPNAPNAGSLGSGETPATGWFSWLYYYFPSTVTNSNTTASASPPPAPCEEAATNPSAGELPANKTDAQREDNSTPCEHERTGEAIEYQQVPQKRSWFQMWSGGRSSSPSQKGDEHQKDPPNSTGEQPAQNADIKDQQNGISNHPQEADTSKQVVKNGKPSGWSFWSRDTPKRLPQGGSQESEGIGTPPALDLSNQAKDTTLDTKPNIEVPQNKNIKPKNQKDNIGIPGDVSPSPSTPPPVENTASKQLQKVLPNQVVPRFKDTFAFQGPPSFVQTIGRFLHYSKEPENKHVYVVRDPPHIRRALAVGVHGYFPAPFIRSVLGQPTGTSVKFANMAASAVKKWTDTHGYECAVEKIALEGEGRIAERVDLLWKLLLNWIEEIRKADFILFACHSQGVPVTVMLIARLIAFGCLDAARVGVCAMAGVNLGPFPDYKSRWIGGSAGELFEFAVQHSQVSKDYEDSLSRALDFGVRISYVGSIDDQLVSLEVMPSLSLSFFFFFFFFWTLPLFCTNHD